MYPRQSPTTHTEQLGDEASVYDWARGQVHALNPTAARVWRHCDGATSRDAIAAALRAEMGIPEADAVVDLTLAHLARVHLLELPVESRSDRSKTTRRWLLSRGVATALLPAIYSIVAPSPLDAQSLGASAPPTLTSVTPNQGVLGTTVAVTLTGTNFVIGATTVTVNSGGVSAANVIVSSATSLTCDIVITPTATTGAHTVTVTTPGGTTAAQTFTVNLAPPTLTSVSPSVGIRGTTVAVTLTGTDFVVGATTVAVSGTLVTVNTVVVSSSTSLTANFVIDPAAAPGGRAVTVTTAGGTSGPQTFTVGLLAPTLTNISPNQGTKALSATTVAVTLTGTNFVVGATTVNVSGTGLTINTVVVSSSTSLTANFVLDPAAATGGRTVTVTTAFGTSGAQTFTINPGSMSFAFTGGAQTFTVPPGVTTLTVTAEGAQGAGSAGGRGGNVIATVAVLPSDILDVFVGGQGALGSSGGLGGFNGGGAGGTGTSFFAGGGGGASDIRRGGSALANRVVVAGGGGGATFGGFGGAGGGTTGGTGTVNPPNVTAAGGGTQSAGGLGGVYALNSANNGQPGASGTGGQGGPDVLGGAAGGGGGGGYFGGGGGAGGGAQEAGTGGGGSSFPPGATHTQGARTGNGAVTIIW